MGHGSLVDQNGHTGEEEGAGGCLDKRLYSAWAEERGKVSCKCPLLATSHDVTMEEHFGCMHALYCYGPLNLVKHTTNLKLKLQDLKLQKRRLLQTPLKGQNGCSICPPLILVVWPLVLLVVFTAWVPVPRKPEPWNSPTLSQVGAGCQFWSPLKTGMCLMW